MTTKHMTPSEVLSVDASTVKAGDTFELVSIQPPIYEVPAHWQVKEKPQRTLRNNPNN